MLRYTLLPAYQLLVKHFPLPSVSLLKRLSQGGLKPLKAVKVLLNERKIDKDIVLLTDEMYLQSSSYSVFIRCFPFSRDGRIYPIPSAISRTPSLHLSRLRAFLPGLLRSSSLSLASHFKIQSNPQNTIVIPPQYMSIPSNSICCC